MGYLSGFVVWDLPSNNFLLNGKVFKINGVKIKNDNNIEKKFQIYKEKGFNVIDIGEIKKETIEKQLELARLYNIKLIGYIKDYIPKNINKLTEFFLINCEKLNTDHLKINKDVICCKFKNDLNLLEILLHKYIKKPFIVYNCNNILQYVNYNNNINGFIINEL